MLLIIKVRVVSVSKGENNQWIEEYEELIKMYKMYVITLEAWVLVLKGGRQIVQHVY